VLQFSQRLRLDLANAFARHRELPNDSLRILEENVAANLREIVTAASADHSMLTLPAFAFTWAMHSGIALAGILPKHKRQTEEQAKPFAKKAMERIPSSGDPCRQIMSWLIPRIGKS
jgi:hypothetical protein